MADFVWFNFSVWVSKNGETVEYTKPVLARNFNEAFNKFQNALQKEIDEGTIYVPGSVRNG